MKTHFGYINKDKGDIFALISAIATFIERQNAQFVNHFMDSLPNKSYTKQRNSHL